MKQSKFDIWWNLDKTKRVVGILYSLGASVVILGAMFKILHLPLASYILGLGMTTEAVIFALGIFEKPFHIYEWEKVFDFDNVENENLISAKTIGKGVSSNTGKTSIDLISDSDMKRLNEGIQNLITTTNQIASLSNVIGSSEELTKSIDLASDTTRKFVESQGTLTNVSEKMIKSYSGVSDNMDQVERSTKSYGAKVEDMTKNLTSINAIYEVQLKDIQSQSHMLSEQNEQIKKINSFLSTVGIDTEKMNKQISASATETEKYKEELIKLAKQISDLNRIYGNMLNAATN